MLFLPPSISTTNWCSYSVDLIVCRLLPKHECHRSRNCSAHEVAQGLRRVYKSTENLLELHWPLRWSVLCDSTARPPCSVTPSNTHVGVAVEAFADMTIAHNQLNWSKGGYPGTSERAQFRQLNPLNRWPEASQRKKFYLWTAALVRVLTACPGIPDLPSQSPQRHKPIPWTNLNIQ